ncbi:MAG TPA: hypothetical protein VJV79_37120 [Polyangiaceae bacterium]|nr:hypothetical protein [Polyangiaceae bacterium]
MSRHSPERDMARSFALDAPRVGALSFSALLLAAFFLVPYLPMVDMPQHAAQIAIWLHLHDPKWAEFQLFELNFRTPYLGAYALARALSGLVGVVPALKVVVWLSIVGHWAAFDWLVRSLGHARWLGLLGLPLGMGYGFYFGFISFIGALPFGICAICLALRHRAQPSLASGLWLGTALCATLSTHGFALGLTLVLVAPLLLRGAGSLFARGAPLLAPALLMLVWLVPGSSARSIGLTVWDPRFWELRQIPGLLLASSGADHGASALGVVVLGIVLLSLGRPNREPERLLPLLVMLLGYCLFPLSLGGFTPLHPRFAAFLVPSVLLAFQPSAALRSPYLDGLIAVTCAVWFCLFAIRLQRFARETQPIVDFVERMPQSLYIRPLIFERESNAFPGLPAMLHLSAYYVPEKGGYQGYSFAMYPTSVVRYHPEIEPTMNYAAEWHPEWFSAADELGGYHCFLVHSSVDRSAELFGAQLDQLNLVFHEQGWWAYARR